MNWKNSAKNHFFANISIPVRVTRKILITENVDRKFLYIFCIQLFSLRWILFEIQAKTVLPGNAACPALPDYLFDPLVSQKVLVGEKKVVYEKCREFYNLYFCILKENHFCAIFPITQAKFEFSVIQSVFAGLNYVILRYSSGIPKMWSTGRAWDWVTSAYDKSIPL